MRRLLSHIPHRAALVMTCLTVVGAVLVGLQQLPISDIFALDPVEDLQQEIDKLEELKQKSENATSSLENEVGNLENRIANAQAGIESARAEADELAGTIEQREEDLAVQYTILSRRIAEQYKRARTASPLLLLFANDDAATLTKDLAYRNSVKAQDNRLLTSIADDIETLEEDKEALEARQEQLASLQTQLDEQAAFFREEIAKAREYQQELNTQIAELSARQQQIIDSRSGGFTVSGDSELADDYLASIKGFNEQAPGGYFGVFSFGAYSHRNGMSQYGALGRAKEGQNYEEILAAYYSNGQLQKDYDAMDQISVEGYGTMSFEDTYLKSIYEVPGSWPKEVLKAQAIAARTYAIRYTNNGSRSICTDERCQVYKQGEKGGAWNEAVEETRGMVLTDGGGNLISTQYASTHGGWSRTGGWDTTDGEGGSDLLSKSYDAIGGSPWLYKSWWREGYSSSGSTCGRENPWLSPEEMADIVNAHLVLTNGSSSETERISPVSDCWGGDPYSLSELREVADDYGGLDSASGVSVSLGEGRTNTVSIDGVSMSGDEFCKAFNLRAPGNMRIPQWSGASCTGAFFNVEHK